MPPIRAVLLDIEGTTSSIRFVHEVLFPYARQHLRSFLRETPTAEEAGSFGEALDLVAAETGAPRDDLAKLATALERLMDADSKTTGLKQLQGLIWKRGYETGELVSDVYPDVEPALRAWRARGLEIRIYSSGSVGAQKLFFAHTESGDLLELFSGHHDTRVGPKREASSYRAIAGDWGVDPGAILFASDVVEELDAAREAGLETVLCLRPGNAPVAPGHGHREARSFDVLL